VTGSVTNSVSVDQSVRNVPCKEEGQGVSSYLPHIMCTAVWRRDFAQGVWENLEDGGETCFCPRGDVTWSWLGGDSQLAL